MAGKATTSLTSDQRRHKQVATSSLLRPREGECHPIRRKYVLAGVCAMARRQACMLRKQIADRNRIQIEQHREGTTPLEKFYRYIYSKKSVVETDHKRLESIWKKSIASASPRLQRLLLRMSKYNVDVVYIPGETNVVAEAFSRVCFRELPSPSCDSPQVEVETITQLLPATPAKLQEVRDATIEDITTSHLKDVIYHGWPKHMMDCPHDFKEYWDFREDLSVED